jgi:hypothetical protein
VAPTVVGKVESQPVAALAGNRPNSVEGLPMTDLARTILPKCRRGGWAMLLLLLATQSLLAAEAEAVAEAAPAANPCAVPSPVLNAREMKSAQDVTSATQNAMNRAWAGNRDCNLPAGVFRNSGLTLPGNAAGRDKAFRLSGQGTGEIFFRPFSGGTILYNAEDAPVLKFAPDVPLTSGGTSTIDHIRFEGNSSSSVVELGSFLGQSTFNNNALFQAGAGDGFRSLWSTTVDIHNNYSINRDWPKSGLAGARVGAGFRITQLHESGLTTLRKNTSRGWRDGYVLGDGKVAMYSPKITDSEVSVTYNGILIQSLVRKAHIHDNYMEGGEGGTGILDLGNWSSIRGNLVLSGFGTGIDASARSTYGTVISENLLAAEKVPNTVLMKVGSGGVGKVVSGNTFTFAGSGGNVPGVVGLQITGVDPRIDWHDNIFVPRGPWVGGPGTKKVDNRSTSADGTPGTGVYGMGIAQSKNQMIEAPHLSRGAVNLKVDPTALVDADVSSGVLALGELSVFTVTMVSPVSISSFSAPNLPDKTFDIHITNNRLTLVQGPLLKLAGSVNFTPGPNGSWHKFQIKPGGVAYETSRIVY